MKLTPLLLCSFLAVATSASAQTHPRVVPDPPPAPSTAAPSAPSDKLQVAAPQSVDHSVRKLAGHTVYGPQGDRIGVIKDFVIEKQTGRVVYAVVSTGGLLGAGDALKLIPIHALLSAPAGAAGFSIRVSQADWNRAPALIEEAFDRGIVIVSAEHQRLHDEIFGPAPRTQPRSAAPLPLDRDAALAASPWVRATHLRGKDLHSGADEIGEIEDIVIDLNRHTATALVELEDNLSPTEQRILVPLTELTLDGRDRNRFATHYTRQDFARLDPAYRATSDQNLLPTGRPASDSAAVRSPEATLASAARSARQALDNDPVLARANLQIIPEHGTLILRGRVPTEQLRDRAHAAIKDAASGIPLRNDVIVDPR